jgi:hypothetical protein
MNLNTILSYEDVFGGQPMKRKLLKAAKDKRQPPLPTAAEMRILQVLWDREEATVENYGAEGLGYA